MRSKNLTRNKTLQQTRTQKKKLKNNLNGDDKRFWLGRLVDINDKKSNNSTSLNPEFFAERFELNDNF